MPDLESMPSRIGASTVVGPVASDERRLARVALAGLARMAYARVHMLVAAHGPEQALERVLAGEAPPADPDKFGDPREWAANVLRRTQRIGGRVITPEDDEWPPQLADLAAAPGAWYDIPCWPVPLCLWVRGQASLADVLHRSVAVVGSRHASGYGLQSALGTQFVDNTDLFVEHTLLMNSADIIAHLVVGIDVMDLQPATIIGG